MKWNVACAAMKGTTHQQNNEKCQDMTWMSVSDRFACITMADGAGTAAYGAEGATLAVEATKRWLEETGLELFGMDASAIRTKVVSLLRDELIEECRQRQCSTIELSTTVLFVASDGQNVVAASIGDGLVGRIGNDGEQEVILGQDIGRYVNESHFITDPDSEGKLRVFIGPYIPGSTYFLLTDGACDCLFNDRKGTFAPALHTFVRWLHQYPHQAVSKAIRQKMYDIFPSRTDDDCAIALLSL